MNNKANILIAMGALLPYLSSKYGSSSVIYDFRHLSEGQFHDRRIRRYKKKFPRYRVIPKWAKDYEIFVYYLPNLNPITTTYRKANDVLHPQRMTKHDIFPDFQRPLQPFVKVVKSIFALQLDEHPNRKVLLISEQLPRATQQITPFMMMHMIGEAIYNLEGINIEVYPPRMLGIPLQIDPELQFNNTVHIAENDLIIIRRDDGSLSTINGVLPKNKVTKNLIRRSYEQLNGYAFPSNSKYASIERSSKNELLSDAVASMLISGRVNWITPNNSPAFKKWLESRYDIVQYPASYEPLIQMWTSRVNTMMKEFADNQLFFA